VHECCLLATFCAVCCNVLRRPNANYYSGAGGVDFYLFFAVNLSLNVPTAKNTKVRDQKTPRTKKHHVVFFGSSPVPK
jgi:hypothetical protein